MANDYYTRAWSDVRGIIAKAAKFVTEFQALETAFDSVQAVLKRSIKLPADVTTDQVITQNAASRANKVVGFDSGGTLSLKLNVATGGITFSGVADGETLTPSADEFNSLFGLTPGTVLTTGDSGAGNGIDADLLDGLEGAAYPKLANVNSFAQSQIISAAAEGYLELRDTAGAADEKRVRLTNIGGDFGVVSKDDSGVTVATWLAFETASGEVAQATINGGAALNLNATALNINGSDLLSTATTSDGAALVAYKHQTAGAFTTGAVARKVQGKLDRIAVVDVCDFLPDGFVTDGSVDYSSHVQMAFDEIPAGGGLVLMPQFPLLFGAQVTLSGSGRTGRIHVIGYGCEILTTGTISGLKVLGQSTPHGVTIEGLKVNHRGNSDAVCGFQMASTNHLVLRDCLVEAHGTNSTYAAARMEQSEVNNASTACFWTTFDNFTCRRRSSADAGFMQYGIHSVGVNNATRIIGGSLNHTNIGVALEKSGTGTVVANALLVDGVSFEALPIAVWISNPSTSGPTGLRILNNRAEDCGIFLYMTGTPSVNGAVRPWLTGNYLQTFSSSTFTTVTTNNRITLTNHGLSDKDPALFTSAGTPPTGLVDDTMYFVSVVDDDTIELYDDFALTSQATFTASTGSGTHTLQFNNYVYQTTSLEINTFDWSTSPNLPISLTNQGGLSIAATAGASHGLTVTPGGAGRGLLLNDNARNAIATLTWTGTSDHFKLQGQGDVQIQAGSSENVEIIKSAAGNIMLTSLPTSAAGLPTGALWNNSGVINIA